MSGEGRISHVLVAAVGTRRLVSVVKRGCAAFHGGAGRITIVSCSTLAERLATRCPLSETCVPILQSEDLVAARIPVLVEALLLCPDNVSVDYEILVDWTTRSALHAVLRAAPDAVVLDGRLSPLRRALQRHFFVRATAGKRNSPDLFLIGRPPLTAT